MQFQFTLSRVKDSDSELAAKSIISDCRMQLGDRSPSLLMIFISIRIDALVVLSRLHQVFPTVPLIGCSSAAEISDLGPEQGAIVLLALCGIRVEIAMCKEMGSDTFNTGQLLARKFSNDFGRLLFLFCDGLAGDRAALLNGLLNDLKKPLPIVGGAASDDMQFRQTFQFYNEQIHTCAAVAVVIDGDFEFGIGVRHGWEPVGLTVNVTKSIKNRVVEINGMPAMKLYEEYFGDYAKRLRTEPLARLAIYYPLGLPVSEEEEYLLRAPLEVELDESIRFSAEVPEGSRVRLMMGSEDRAIDAARIAAMETLAQMHGKTPRLALVINGVGRYKMLGRKAGDELDAIRQVLGEKIQFVGYYAFGQFAPFVGSGTAQSCFHNETIVILTLG